MGRGVKLTLSSGLVAWGNSWSSSLENAWHENVVPLLLDEWMSAKLIQRSDHRRSRQTQAAPFDSHLAANCQSLWLDRSLSRATCACSGQGGNKTYSFFLFPFFLKFFGFFPAVMSQEVVS